MKKILFSVAGIVIGIPLILYLFVTVLGLVVQDAKTVNDQDLLVAKVSVPNPNAYDDLETALATLKYPASDEFQLNDELTAAVNGTAWNEQLVQETLANNAEALRLFTSASEKSYQHPWSADPSTFTTGASLPLPNYNGYRRLAQLETLQSIQLLKNGQPDKALRSALRPVKLGQAMESSQSLFIGYSLGRSIKKMGLDAISRIANEGTPSGSAKTETAAVLEKTKGSVVDLQQALRTEYSYTAHYPDTADAERLNAQQVFGQLLGILLAGNRFYYEPVRTDQLIANEYKRIIEQVAWPCGQQLPAPSPPASFSPLRRLFQRNAIGKFGAENYSSLISVSSLESKRCELETKIDQLIARLQTAQ